MSAAAPLLSSDALPPLSPPASTPSTGMKLSSSREHLHGARRCNIAAIVCMLLTITGIIITTVVHDAIQAQLQSGLAAQYVLDSTSAGGYASWADSNAPNSGSDFTDFYVYNITNAQDVALYGAKPNVSEIGPLRYVFNQVKLNVTWDPEDNGDIVTYNQWQYYTAVDQNTLDLEKMVVITPNVPLLGALHNAYATGANAAALAFLLELQGYTDPSMLFTNRTAYEVVWGWEDPLLALIHDFGIPTPTYYPGIQENDTSEGEALARHGSNRIYTGKATTNLAREYVEWNGMDQLSCCAFGPCGDSTSGAFPQLPFATQAAELIHGAFGEQFHQFISSDETLRVNSMAFGIFRTWDMTCNGGESYDVQGINLLKFRWADYVLGNQTTTPEDAFAYNSYGPSGLLNQSICEWGARIFVSKPRFLDGSDSLRNGIANLLPADEDSHGTFLGVEPYTGQTMDFHWRVGINVYVAPDSLAGVPFFPAVTPVYMPMAWADRYGSVTGSEASDFKSKVYIATNLIAAARWGGIALACVAFLSSAAFFYVASVRRRRLEEARDMESGLYWTDQFRPFLSADGLQPVYPATNGADGTPTGGSIQYSSVVAEEGAPNGGGSGRANGAAGGWIRDPDFSSTAGHQ